MKQGRIEAGQSRSWGSDPSLSQQRLLCAQAGIATQARTGQHWAAPEKLFCGLSSNISSLVIQPSASSHAVPLAQRLRREPQRGNVNENHLSKAGQHSRQIDEGTGSGTVLPSVAAAGGSPANKLCLHCKALVLLAHTWMEGMGTQSRGFGGDGFRVGIVSQLKVWAKLCSLLQGHGSCMRDLASGSLHCSVYPTINSSLG